MSIPILSVVAFFLAVFAGLFAATYLAIDLVSGLSGFYDDKYVIAFFVAAGAMLVFLAVAIGLGVRELRRRGRVPGLVRSFPVAAVVELIVIAGLVAAESTVGGSRVFLLVDLLVVVFVGGLFAWSLATWWALLKPSPGRRR
jgi:hypothetical protein